MGFGAWRREHRGKSRYEVARHLLKSAIAYKDILNDTRNPMMHSYESSDRKHNPEESPDENQRQDELFATAKRLEKVNEARREFYLNRLDAEVLWPDRIPGLCDPLMRSHNELVVNFRTYYTLTKKTKRTADNDALLERAQAVIWAGGDEDRFKAKVDATLKALDDFLRPHIMLR